MAFGKRPMAGHVSTFEMWGGMPGEDLQRRPDLAHRTSYPVFYTPYSLLQYSILRIVYYSILYSV